MATRWLASDDGRGTQGATAAYRRVGGGLYRSRKTQSAGRNPQDARGVSA